MYFLITCNDPCNSLFDFCAKNLNNKGIIE